MTFLWIGLVLVALFLLFFGWLIALGLVQRVEDRREVDAEYGSDPAPFLPRRLGSDVPQHLHPHTSWPDVKDRHDRDTPPPSDPAS